MYVNDYFDLLITVLISFSIIHDNKFVSLYLSWERVILIKCDRYDFPSLQNRSRNVLDVF